MTFTLTAEATSIPLLVWTLVLTLMLVFHTTTSHTSACISAESTYWYQSLVHTGSGFSSVDDIRNMIHQIGGKNTLVCLNNTHNITTDYTAQLSINHHSDMYAVWNKTLVTQCQTGREKFNFGRFINFSPTYFLKNISSTKIWKFRFSIFNQNNDAENLNTKLFGDITGIQAYLLTVLTNTYPTDICVDTASKPHIEVWIKTGNIISFEWQPTWEALV